MTELFGRLRRFLQELKRRKVYRVAAVYAAVAFVTLQAAQLIFPATTLEGVYEVLVVIAFVGFPIAVVLAWAFEVTPEGVRRSPEADPAATEAAGTGADARTGYKVIVAIGLLAACVAGVWYLVGGSESPPRAGPRSVAVLPFEELGRDDPGTLTRGMHEEVITRLSNVSGISVTASRAVQRYRGTDETTAQIARELGVKWILTGNVQRVGEKIEVSARLIDPRTDTNAWADEYPRELNVESIFAIQEEITRQIVRSLEAKISSEESERIARRPTQNLDAFRLYVRGRSLLEQRAESEIRSAVGYFERAIARDSSYAVAWSGLADAQSLLWFYRYAPADSVSEPALEAAQRAVELAPDLGEARASLGIVRSLRHEGAAALKQLRRAVSLKPSHPEAHVWLSWVHLLLGRPGQALEPGRRAVDLDPRAPPYRVYLAEALLANGRDEPALRQAREAVELGPDYGLAHFVKGVALHHLGRHSEAESAWQKALSLVPPRGTPTHPEVRAAMASARSAAGDTAGARELLSRIVASSAPFAEAHAHAAVGELNRAFDALERAESWGSFTNENARYYFPEALGPLRADARYATFRRRLNRAWGLNADGTSPDSVDVSLGSDSDD